MRLLEAVRILGAVLALLPFAAGTAAAATITLGGSSFLRVEADDGSGGFDVQEVFPSSIPFQRSNLARGGLSTASATYDLSSTALDVRFELVREPDSFVSPYTESFNVIDFSVSEDVGYDLRGGFSAVDSEGRRIRLFARLLDDTNGVDLFSNEQESRATANESFILGGTGGDFSNSLTGSLTGTLVAGNRYLLISSAFLVGAPAPTAGVAAGTGAVTLTLVPEPSTAGLVGLGLCALAAARRRPTRAASLGH